MIEGKFYAKYIGESPIDPKRPGFYPGHIYKVNITSFIGFPSGMKVTCLNDEKVYNVYKNPDSFSKSWVMVEKYDEEDKNMNKLLKFGEVIKNVHYKGENFLYFDGYDFTGYRDHEYFICSLYYDIIIKKVLIGGINMDHPVEIYMVIPTRKFTRGKIYYDIEDLLKDWEITDVEDEKEDNSSSDSIVNDSNDTIKVITLCGSSRYQAKFDEVQRNLALQGYIVLSLDFFTKAEKSSIDEALKMQRELASRNLSIPIIDSYIDNINNTRYPSGDHLMKMHRAKIDMSDAIFVINVDNYIGNHGLNEIEYAYSKGKKVFYLSKYPDMVIPKEVWN